MASNSTARRATRANSKQPEPTLPGTITSEPGNTIDSTPSQLPTSSDAQQTTNKRPPRKSSKRTTNLPPRGNSKRPKTKLSEPAAPTSNDLAVSTVLQSSVSTGTATTAGVDHLAMVPHQTQSIKPGGRRNRKRLAAEMSLQTISESDTTADDFKPPPTKKRTTRATSKQPEHLLSKQLPAQVENSEEPGSLPASPPTNAVRAMDLPTPATTSKGRSSKQPENNHPTVIARRDNDSSREAPTKHSASIKPESTTAAHELIAVPTQTEKRTTLAKSKQSGSKTTLATIAQTENDSEQELARQPSSTTPPPRTAKRSTRANSKQPERQPAPLAGVDVENSLDNYAPPSTTTFAHTESTATAGPPPLSRKRTSRGNLKSPEQKILHPSNATTKRSTAPDVPQQLTVRGPSASSPNTTVNTDAPGRPHPDTCFNQPLPRITPAAASPLSLKRTARGNIQHPEQQTLAPSDSTTQGSTTPDVPQQLTVRRPSASPPNTTFSTDPPAPPHPDPYFNQPLSVIIPRSKPPPHAFGTALPSNAFSCSMCPSIVHGSANSVRHCRSHDIVEVQCRLCEKQFRTSDSYKGHWIRHHADKPRMWIIGELKSFYNNWKKSGVEKWCGDWPGVVGSEGAVKGKNTTTKAKTAKGKGKATGASARSVQSEVPVEEVQKAAPETNAAPPQETKTSLTLEVSAQEVSEQGTELQEATDEDLGTGEEKETDGVLEHAPIVAEQPETEVREPTKVLSKKRKAEDQEITDDVVNTNLERSTADDQTIAEQQQPRAAKRRTTKKAPTKTKKPTTMKLPLIPELNNLVSGETSADQPSPADTAPEISSNASATQEEKASKNKAPATTTAKEPTEPRRSTRKRKTAIETPDLGTTKETKTVNTNEDLDRLRMPPPALPARVRETTPELTDAEVAERELERRRILAEALSRFQVYMVPRELLQQNATDNGGDGGYY